MFISIIINNINGNRSQREGEISLNLNMKCRYMKLLVIVIPKKHKSCRTYINYYNKYRYLFIYMHHKKYMPLSLKSVLSFLEELESSLSNTIRHKYPFY